MNRSSVVPHRFIKVLNKRLERDSLGFQKLNRSAYRSRYISLHFYRCHDEICIYCEPSLINKSFVKFEAFCYVTILRGVEFCYDFLQSGRVGEGW